MHIWRQSWIVHWKSKGLAKIHVFTFLWYHPLSKQTKKGEQIFEVHEVPSLKPIQNTFTSYWGPGVKHSTKTYFLPQMNSLGMFSLSSYSKSSFICNIVWMFSIALSQTVWFYLLLHFVKSIHWIFNVNF